MKLVELVHRDCCGSSIDKIILRKLEEHRGGFRKVAETLSQACDSDILVQPLSNSTITMWVMRLGIQHEVGLIRRTFGRSENLDLSDSADPTSELTSRGSMRVQEAIKGVCTRCEAPFDFLISPTLLSVQEEKSEMVLVINAHDKAKGRMQKHWFPLNRDKIAEYTQSDHDEDSTA